MSVNILAVGDVCGTGGIRILQSKLRTIQKFNSISFTVVNAENASGLGVTPSQCEDIFAAGADAITLGNHTWGRNEIKQYLDDCPYIFRPANFAPQVPGRGYGIVDAPFGKVCVVNLIGRCGMNFGPESPFFEIDKILKKNESKIVLIDFHAEATSEKAALARYVDGRATAVWGTHTHVQTSDSCVLSGGTGFITDIGMTGAIDSVIGINPEQSISTFLGNPPRRYEQAKGSCKIECAIFEVDEKSGRCLSVTATRITE